MHSMLALSNFPLNKEQNDTSSEHKMLGTANSNDVTIYRYPKVVFPPTDCHTATYIKSNENDDQFFSS